MKELFAPAIGLMNRLRYPGRLLLIGTLAFIAIAILLVSQAAHLFESISFTRRELASVELIRPIHTLIRLVQQHRGISSAYLSGDPSLLPKVESRQVEMAKAIAELDAVEQRHASVLHGSAEWSEIKAEWRQLQADVTKLQPQENMSRHSKLIERMLRFQITMADSGGLSLDSELHTYYLGAILCRSLPDMLERLGKLRAKGTAILVRNELSDLGRSEILVNNALLKQAIVQLGYDSEKAGQTSPGVQQKVRSFSLDLDAAVKLAVALLEREIVAGHLSVAPGEFFDQFTTAIDIGYRAMFDTLVPLLTEELTQRADRLYFFLLLEFGIALLLVLLLAYLSIGAYYSIIESVRRLSAGAVQIAGGDLTATISLAGRDELTEVANSFNTMAGALDHMLTQSRQKSAELSEALTAAQLADQAKDAFLANVSHELRTPLNAVIGLGELALRPNCRPEKRQEYLGKIAEAGRNLASIVNDLLDLSKIAAGRMELVPEAFYTSELLARVESIMSFRLKEKGLQLRHQIVAEVPEVLVGDSLRIEQLMLNLLSNAIKFTHRGHVELRLGLAGRQPDRVGLRIEVEDTGIGMKPAEVTRLFQPFSQVDASMSRKYGGTGLGLALCKRIAELMDGDVSVVSEPGRGSTFSAVLWLGIGSPGEVADAQPAGDGGADACVYHDVRVLAVDDQPMNREIVSELLSSVGIVVRLAENGQQALDILHEVGPNCFDLVLMDIQMPVLDGLKATRRLREQPEFGTLPIIAMTAHTMEHEKEISASAGMIDHIGKPFDSTRFYQVLRKWIPVAKQEIVTLASPADETGQHVALLDALAEIPGLNAVAAVERFGGKEERYQKWLEDFVQTGAAVSRAVLDDIAAGRHDVAAKTVHAFKGRVGTLGMETLHAEVLVLEQELRAGGATATAKANALADTIDAMIAQLQEVFAHREETLRGDSQGLRLITWSDSWSVGVPQLDEQHKRLIAMINRLADVDARKVAFPAGVIHEVLAGLADYSQQHFKAEEAHMRGMNYPDLENHLNDHATFVEKLGALSISASCGALDVVELHGFLSRWLRDHILETDMRYRRSG